MPRQKSQSAVTSPDLSVQVWQAKRDLEEVVKWKIGNDKFADSDRRTVMEAKENLHTLNLLTHPTDYFTQRNCENMWSSIEKNYLPEDKTDHNWVIWFTKSVTQARKMPSFYYLSNLDRKELLIKINNYSNKLISLLKKNGLDANIFYSEKDDPSYIFYEDNLINGFGVYEELNETLQLAYSVYEKEQIPFNAILNLISSHSARQLSEIKNEGNAGDTVKITRFIRSLHASNIQNFGKALNSVTSKAVSAIYKAEYTESMIFNLTKLKTQNPL